MSIVFLIRNSAKVLLVGAGAGLVCIGAAAIAYVCFYEIVTFL